MSTLLLKITGNMSLNRTIFPPSLLVYEDVLVYRKRYLHRVREITISYTHIVQVNLMKGIIFASLDIINSGGEDISIKYVFKKDAVRAKKLIDQKIHRLPQKDKSFVDSATSGVHNFEKSLARINELLSKGKISEREYNKKRREFLEDIE